MDHSVMAGWVTVIIGTLAALMYFRSIFKGETRPHLFTWAVWGILGTINFAAQIQGGAGPGAWASGVLTFFSFIAAALSLKYGDRHITRSDWIALIFALLSIIPWLLTDDPLISVVLITAIDWAGYYPTIRKSWHRPWDENLSSYAVGSLNLFISLFAMKNISIVTCMYPSAIVIINSAFIAMCLIRRRSVERPH